VYFFEKGSDPTKLGKISTLGSPAPGNEEVFVGILTQDPLRLSVHF